VEGRQIALFVYSRREDTVRVVPVVPSSRWAQGGAGRGSGTSGDVGGPAPMSHGTPRRGASTGCASGGSLPPSRSTSRSTRSVAWVGDSAGDEDRLQSLLGCHVLAAWLHECLPDSCQRTPGRALSLEGDVGRDAEGELDGPDAVTCLTSGLGPGAPLAVVTPRYSLTPRAGDVLGSVTPRWVTPIREALVGGGGEAK
jgi:hypothetical protein